MINRFSGKYDFLSNFYPCKIKYEGLVYESVEHAFVAAKTTDQNIRLQIQKIRTPGDAKKFGRKLKLRNDWENIKINVMTKLIVEKFVNNENLENKLIDTGNEELIEGNWWGDTFWGIYNGEGRNELGKILMSTRVLVKVLNKK